MFRSHVTADFVNIFHVLYTSFGNLLNLQANDFPLDINTETSKGRVV
jgi:hypothetical protein